MMGTQGLRWRGDSDGEEEETAVALSPPVIELDEGDLDNIHSTLRTLVQGRQCGRCTCHGVDLATRGNQRGWIEGRVISVLAEAYRAELGLAARAEHVLPLVLHSIQAILDAPDDRDRARGEMGMIIKQLSQISPPDQSGSWLIPALVPGHWTLVAIEWTVQRVRFFDSLPMRLAAEVDEKRVRDEV
ncbi:hypothetical protein K439DRAFT_337099 [Ramaria rubella]|nr:hypothetical protein K439DRAFT_337099 [Ramaria rubella]